MHDLDEIIDKALVGAWHSRKNARVYGATKVGAAAVSETGDIIRGCNIEHRFRSHDIHAEQNAIGTFVSSGLKELIVVVIVAKRDYFSPCGSCMDWIMEIGGPQCKVIFQSSEVGPLTVWSAKELMPHYPF